MSLRVVYDTQMLVPRDDMVPALVFNPQNPPPWLQNTTVQPQIIYAQQQQQHYVQQVQQVDNNQVYLQQYQYQNPQMFIPNYDQIRPIQIMQNVMQFNPDHSNERMQSMQYPTHANIPNPIQTNPIPNPVPHPVPLPNMQHSIPIQNIQNQIKSIPVQNQQLPDRIDPTARLRNLGVPNVIQVRPIDPRPQNAPNVPRPEFRPSTRVVRPQNLPIQRAMNANIVRTPRFAYRPIQPRVRSQISVQKRFVQSSNTPNIILTNVNNVNNMNTVENNVSRKRKSESPDEIQNKLNILAINNSPTLMGHLVTKSEVKDTVASNSVSTQIQKGDLEVPNSQTLVMDSSPANIGTEKDKLVRNTVFTQARGRILNAKNDVNTENVLEDKGIQIEDKKESEEPKIDIKDDKISLKENDGNIKDVNIGLNNRSENDLNMKLSDKDYILTHVLDGFVIQESNVAFPIRKPLVEKTIKLSSEAVELNPIDDIVDKDLEEHIPSVAIVVERKKTEEKEDDRDNPFKNLSPAIVKTWTVDQLVSHLDKMDWKETASSFSEHEMDGESLLLVSKSQLMTIGVKESHADIIMEFVNQ